MLNALLKPHIAILWTVTLASAVLLSVGFVVDVNVISYISYVLSFYSLVAWCIRIPNIIAFSRGVVQSNRLTKRLLEDTYFRVKMSLFCSVAFNVIFGGFQLWLGIYHGSLWYYALATYYIVLTFARFLLLKFTITHSAQGIDMENELKKYRACGFLLLVLSVALTGILFFIIVKGSVFIHYQITVIAIAVFTFIAFTVATVNLIRYKKYKSPVFSACKTISFAAACVSMLTLESTMLTAFGEERSGIRYKRLLGASGGAVLLFMVAIAFYMIIYGTKRLGKLREEKPNEKR